MALRGLDGSCSCSIKPMTGPGLPSASTTTATMAISTTSGCLLSDTLVSMSTSTATCSSKQRWWPGSTIGGRMRRAVRK